MLATALTSACDDNRVPFGVDASVAEIADSEAADASMLGTTSDDARDVGPSETMSEPARDAAVTEVVSTDAAGESTEVSSSTTAFDASSSSDRKTTEIDSTTPSTSTAQSTSPLQTDLTGPLTTAFTSATVTEQSNDSSASTAVASHPGSQPDSGPDVDETMTGNPADSGETDSIPSLGDAGLYDASQGGDAANDASAYSEDASPSLDASEGGPPDASDGGSFSFEDASSLDAANDIDANFEDSGLTSLSSLQIIGGQYPLKPAFDPDILRYSVVASSSTEVLGLVAGVSSDATISINDQPVASNEVVNLTDIVPGDDISIRVGTGPAATTYLIRYLPAGFPDLVMTYPATGASTDPLYTNISFSNASFAVKLDNNGVPFFYRQETRRVYDVKRHPSGQLSYALWEDPNNAGASHIVFDSNYQETARLKAVGLFNTDHHDFLILPNGNYIFTSYERQVRDLTPFGGGAAVEVRDSVFQEVSPDMQVLFQWNSWDHVDYGESAFAFSPIDYAHANSVYVDDDENWLLSLRGYSQVLKIHRTTGEVLWRLGGVSSDFTFINDPYNGPCGQHTASRLTNGHILLFDNGAECVPEIMGSRDDHTRIVEYALDEDAMTAELVWSYHRDGYFTGSMGSAQRLDNGNTMIGWGNGPPGIATEVDSNGDIVFDLVAHRGSANSFCYRAARFAD